MSNLVTYARTYVDLGFSPLPTLADKRPRGQWEAYQKNRINPDDIEATFTQQGVAGLGIACGIASGNLEVIDLDLDKDVSGTLWDEFVAAMNQTLPDVFAALVIQKSRSGGRHLWYRCEVVEGNQKLAMRPATEEEFSAHLADENTKRKAKSPAQLPKTLIETRGQGGYVCAAPMAGYEFVQNKPRLIPTITPEQRATILEVCRFFNQVVEAPREKASFEHQQRPTGGAKLPGQDFDEQHTALEIMESEGWQTTISITDTRGDQGVRLRKPGSARHDGSAVYYPRLNAVFLFTTDSFLPSEKLLSPFALYAHLEHGGDFKAAAKALAEKGYGEKRERRAPVETQRQPQPKREVNPEASAKSDAPQGERESLMNNAHFRILGFEKTDTSTQAFYFFRKEANVLIRLTAGMMTKANLLTLAPLDWWESNFGKPKGGLDLDMAVNFLIQIGTLKGIFRGEKMIRGRGAWMDAGRVVVHVGDKLIVDGEETAFAAHSSKFVYEAGEELEISTAAPLPVSESKKLADMCNLLNWDRSVNAALLAGWCVIAPVCGALAWRPHLWLTGGAGTGKSWIMKKIVRRCLGNTALAVQGNTSESGIRQTLSADALPVLFDEAEAEDKNAQDRMASVLALMRAASSEDGGQIIKGGSDGNAKRFTIRACFAYSSIAMQLQQQSDRSRVTVLELVAPTNAAAAKARFNQLEAMYNETVTDEWVARLQARTIALLPTILDNAETFAEAVREVVQNQRAGDQLGILLAACWALHSDKKATYAQALEVVKKEQWESERGLNETRDEIRVLGKITEQVERHGPVSRTIGELIANAANKHYDQELTSTTANDILKRCGLKVDKGRVVISDSADWIRHRLKDSPWATTGHRHLLKRLEGAEEIKNTRFAGLSGRAISLPLAPYFIDETPE